MPYITRPTQNLLPYNEYYFLLEQDLQSPIHPNLPPQPYQASPHPHRPTPPSKQTPKYPKADKDALLSHVNNQLHHFIAYQQSMGCVASDSNAPKPLVKRDTVFGILEIRVLEAHIERETSTLISLDPYVNVTFSNQKKTGTVMEKGGKDPKFPDVFKFVVNSYYKTYGRSLSVELKDNNTAIDTLIGHGIVDLEPFLHGILTKTWASPPGEAGRPQDPNTSMRCFLGYDSKEAGFAMVSASFREQPTDAISFRFQTADINRGSKLFGMFFQDIKSKIFGDVDCYIRLTAGEQVLQTKRSKDTKTDKPVWKDEHLTIFFPKSLEDIVIDIMNDGKVICSQTVGKSFFLQAGSKGEAEIVREFKHENQVTARLAMNVILSATPTFKELNGDYKKKLPDAQGQPAISGQTQPGAPTPQQPGAPTPQQQPIPQQQPNPQQPIPQQPMPQQPNQQQPYPPQQPNPQQQPTPHQQPGPAQQQSQIQAQEQNPNQNEQGESKNPNPKPAGPKPKPRAGPRKPTS